jgi:selenium-binding protein 1
MHTKRRTPASRRLAVIAALLAAGSAPARAVGDDGPPRERTLYVWAGDEARLAPDFLAVIDFDDQSPTYGAVLKTVPLPAPGNLRNEPHHCHLSSDRKVLACGGLLSLLSGQNGMFFFDVSDARNPVFLGSTRSPNSAITDDFLPLPGGGFLVTDMGSATGGAPGRVVELDEDLDVVATYPPDRQAASLGGFNPHGIDARPEVNLLVTSDFLNPVTTLNAWAGPIELRGSLRFWNLAGRRLVRTVAMPGEYGTMDVKLIPGDPHGRAVTANMFSGFVYTVDPTDGSAVLAFDCESIVPHVEVPVRGGMVQLLAMPRWGNRLIFASFQAGQIGMLDITDRDRFVQQSVVSLGAGAGPHNIVLAADDARLVVSDYFLNEDDFGKVAFEGDHHVRVVRVTPDALALDPRFDVDFDAAFPTGPARPHGLAMK